MASKCWMLTIFISLQAVFSADTWIPFPDTSVEYMYVTQCRGWQESMDYCRSIGGELASASSITKRDFLVNTVYDSNITSTGFCTTWPDGGDGSYCGGITNQQDRVWWFDTTSTGFFETGNEIDWDVDQNEPDYLIRHTVIGFSLQSRKWHTVYNGDSNVQFCQRIVTRIDCDDEDECKDETLKCAQGGSCSIYCIGESSCSGNAILDGLEATSFSVICSNKDSCKAAHFICPINGGLCSILCSGEKACEDATCDGDQCSFTFPSKHIQNTQNTQNTQQQQKSVAAVQINYALIIMLIYMIIM